MESSICYTGKLELTVCDTDITFDMSMPHERRYVLRELFGCKYPQADIDTLIFKDTIKLGDRLLDAGANIGMTALEALSFGASEIICVEPESSLAIRLRSLKRSGIVVSECALGRVSGAGSLFLSETHNQGHTINEETRDIFPNIFGDKSAKVIIETVSNVLLGKYCDVWKLDVEGAEVDVIESALDLIEKKPPTIFQKWLNCYHKNIVAIVQLFVKIIMSLNIFSRLNSICLICT